MGNITETTYFEKLQEVFEETEPKTRGYKMRLMQKQVQGFYQTLIQDRGEYESWNYINLGMICVGVKNDEGYSRVYAELGCDPDKEQAKKHGYQVIRLTHKYFFTHQNEPHHTDVEYWNWTGNIFDYVKEIKKRKQW